MIQSTNTLTRALWWRLLSAKLERGSGHAALDREAVALLHRAQPLPKPPPVAVGDPVSLVVPVEFYISRR